MIYQTKNKINIGNTYIDNIYFISNTTINFNKLKKLLSKKYMIKNVTKNKIIID